jgi:hypothetical protein
MSLQSLNRENLHHAHIVISDFDSIEDEILEVVENNLNVKTKANEFFYFQKYDKFLIGDARNVFDLHLKKTPKDDLQVFVIAFNFITREAQNAILKMLEEPKDRTVFFIVAPSKSLFLETIISRVSVYEFATSNIESTAKEFLNKKVGDRIKFITGFVKDIREEKKSKQDAIDLLSGLEVEIEKTKNYKALKEIIETRQYMNLNGASVKILLENIALSV